MCALVATNISLLRSENQLHCKLNSAIANQVSSLYSMKNEKSQMKNGKSSLFNLLLVRLH